MSLEIPAIDPTRLLSTFLDLVHIYSPSKHESAVAQYCRQALEACGCSVRIDDTAPMTGSDTGNLIATFPGTAPGRVYMAAHMDTVEPGSGIEPVVAGGVIRSSGDTILGADDKAGIAAIIEALRVLADNPGIPHPEVKVLLTVQEERGLVGAKALDPSGFNGEPCYVLDASEPPGTVVLGAPYQQSFSATFTGKAAHAGISPELGASAIKAAAAAVSALPFGWIDDATSCNVGTIEGGTANNVVAELCSVTGECRSHHEDRIHRLRGEVDETMQKAAQDNGCSVTVAWEENYGGFSYSADDPMVTRALEVAAEIGLHPASCITGGGADTNIFAERGLRAVSLAVGMKDIHSSDESLAVADLEGIATFLTALIVNGFC